MPALRNLWALCVLQAVASLSLVEKDTVYVAATIPAPEFVVPPLLPTLRSIAEAQNWVRVHGSTRIELLPGIHELTSPLILEDKDNGVTWAAHSSAAPSIVSGGRDVTGWTPCGASSLMCAPVTFENAQPRHLYVAGRRVPRGITSASVTEQFAKPISVDPDKYVVDGVKSGASGWNSANADAVEMVYTAQGSPWTESRCTVQNVTAGANGTVLVYMKQPCFATVQKKPCDQSTHTPAHIENTGIADLAPGQWFLDKSTTPPQIVYNPLPGEDVASERVVMPVLETLVDSKGLESVTFTDIVWEYATWSRPNTGLGYVEQQSGALVDRPGTQCIDYEWHPMPSNVVFQDASSVTFKGCTFRHLGAGALQFSGAAHQNSVLMSLFYDVSGTSVQIGEYDTFNETDPAKQAIGNTVAYSLITDVATEYHGNAGIQVGYSKETDIVGNTIANISYSGISIGWGWAREPITYAGNNSIINNRLANFKLQLPYPGASLGDGGGIYALGPQPGSVMNANWLSNMGAGRGGGAIYPDEGSAYWLISDNIFTNASFCADDCEWLHIWTSSIHNITTKDCFTDTTTMRNDGTNTPVTNTTLLPKGGPYTHGEEEIMMASGCGSFCPAVPPEFEY